jgi:hypothetical protein
MIIVDAHTHIGVERLFNLVMSAGELLRIMDRFNIDKAVWAVRELGFRGLKLHTNGFSVPPLNP